MPVKSTWGRSRIVGMLILCLGSRTAQAMDLVRLETRTDLAVARYGVTGGDVVVAVLDRGIDWRHPDFRNPDGTTRIKWLLDMSNAGTRPCEGSDPLPVEYSETDINAALFGGPAINTRDAVGHGTVTAGLAAGNGTAFADGKYRGMAPEADLIVVKLTSEGAPAHGTEYAEAFFQGCNETALVWLDQKITELGKPCVAIINSGIQWGPIDGTSATSRRIDEVFGLHRPGRVFVAPSGDEGGFANHVRGEYASDAPTVVHFTKFTTTTVVMPLWYSGSAPAEIRIWLESGAEAGPIGPDTWIDKDGILILPNQPGQEFYAWASTSGDYSVWLRIENFVGGGIFEIRALEPGAVGQFDLYRTGLDEVMVFDDHLVPGRLSDYASTHSAIVVGAHVNRHEYWDVLDDLWVDASEGMAGDLWLHSSGGPTRDGRLGIDLTAPGHRAFAAYARDSYWSTATWNLIQDGGRWYGGGGATSGSAPIVTGAVALMLDLCPKLTAEQAREILRQTARSDEHTGVTPNLDWGYGKLDVLAALDAVHALCAGDYDFDGDVDGDDVGLFGDCFTGPRIGPVGESCRDRDLDGDSDVDQADFGLFQGCYSGEDKPSQPGCAR